MKNNFSISEVLSYGWIKTREQKWFWPSVVLTIMLISGISAQISEKLDKNSPEAITFNMAVSLISILVGIGIIKLALNQIDGKPLEYSELFTNGKYFLNYFIASLVIGLITFVGLFLLIIPGIYWAIKYTFTTYLIIDQNMGVLDAMKKSGEITKGIKLNLFALGLSFLGVILLGMLVFFVGLLWAIPITWIGTAYLYRKLLKEKVSSSTKKQS